MLFSVMKNLSRMFAVIKIYLEEEIQMLLASVPWTGVIRNQISKLKIMISQISYGNLQVPGP